MNGADAFVATLREWGVDTFFGLPGSTEAPLLEALREDGGIRYVLALHEGVVVAMADGYARAAGRPGVVGLHTTVGAMNGMSQLFNSAKDGVPVVMTVGHKDTSVLAEDGFCTIPDLASLLRPFTKRARQTLAPQSIAADLARSLQAAVSSPSGPTFLAVPEDFMAAPVSSSPEPGSLPGLRRPVELGSGPREEIEAAAKLLAQSSRPLLVLGTAGAPARTQVAELARAAGIAVVAADLTDLASLSYQGSDPGYLGVYGDEPAVLDGCDLVLAVGCRVFYPFSHRLRPRLPEGAALVHIHPDAAQIGMAAAPTVGIVADPKRALQALLEAYVGLDVAKMIAARRARLGELQAKRAQALAQELAASKGQSPVEMADLADAISDALPEGTILVEEAVRGSRLIFRHCGVPKGGEIWRSSGGALGWGLPAAVGAKLARPDRSVVVVVGDGTLHFSVQALWSAVSQRAPIVVVVLDNGGYLAVKRAIENMLRVPLDPRLHPGTEIQGVDHEAAAHAYGAEAVTVTSAAEAGAAIREGLAAERVTVVVVPVAKIRP
ncbi:MAG: thiamine pyrophosphate-binding protein [Candidatus Dormibacteria bacterium]